MKPLQPRDKWPLELDTILPKYFSPAETILDFISEDELETIAMIMFRSFAKRRHYKGGTFKFEEFDCSPIWSMLYPKLKERFDWLRQDDILDGNGYITATTYALHMDSCNPNVYFKHNQIAIKSFILPLFVCKPENNIDSEFVLFKNRLLGWECNFSNKANDVNMVYQQNVASYKGLPWVNEQGNLMELDPDTLYVEDIYEKHLSHLPRETYHSMILESIQPYIPNSILIFDPYQPHTTGNKNYSKTKLKGGIRFNIQRKIQNL